MFATLKNAFKDKDIRRRLLFTLGILVIYQLGAQITVPGVNAAALSRAASTGLISILDTVSGGGLSNYSIFALGVSPFITGQIVVQLLQMDIVPKFVEWSKQGEYGRRKLDQWTRYFTVILAFVQSIGITAGFNYLSQMGLIKNPSTSTYIKLGIILTGGTMFLTWLGDQITDKGLGNGISIIICAGIVSRFPNGFYQLYRQYIENSTPSNLWKGVVFLLVLFILIILITTFVTFVQDANRKITIQYTRRVTSSGDSSYLPLKVNVAGVIPVIFASSFIITPQTILTIFAQNHASDRWYQILSTIFNMQSTPGAILYTILIIIFTFFYAFVQVNPEKVSENLIKQGSYIPSVWPGRETQKYLSSLLKRLSTVGALFLGIIALIPQLAANIFDLPQSIGLGGTSLLIVVEVTLETMRQVEGLLMKRKYIGFIRK